MPPLRSAQIGSTCVMLKRSGCIKPRMSKAISFAGNVLTPYDSSSWETKLAALIKPVPRVHLE